MVTMLRFACLAVLLLALPSTVAAITYTSTDVPKAIPDNNPIGASSTITVTDSLTISDVNVTLNITHPFDADLDIFLISPTAVTIELSTDNGSSGDNYSNTTFDDSAATPITGGTAPFGGSFRPESPLASLNGSNSLGVWTLRVVDDAGADVGTLQSWSLEINGQPTAVPEPSSLLLLGTGITLGRLALRRRRTHSRTQQLE